MHRKPLKFFLALIIFSMPLVTQAVEVVPIGQSIKPEGAEESTSSSQSTRRRRPAVSTMSAGKSFSIESAQILSSSLNQAGEVVYFRASENVGPSSRPVIRQGAIAKANLVEVDKNKKHGKLVIQLSSIEAVDGDTVQLSGTIRIEEQNSAAIIPVGKKFSATLDEKAVVRGRHKKEAFPSFNKNASADILTKLKINLTKGSVKGAVEVILDSSQDIKAEDINPDSILIYRVNNQWLPEEIPAIRGKSKLADRNKDNNIDLTVSFDPLSFIKYQAVGSNTVYFKAKLSNGSEIGASGKVNIEY